jgi:hypothetical protein
MTATVKRSNTCGFESFTLENPAVRATVVPSLGGRIWELTDRERDRQWIWHREGVGLSRADAGAPYDDVWAGGWEELFPNDAPGSSEGRTLPDHGEWWAKSWNVIDATGGETATLRLTSEMDVIRARCTKEIRLERASAAVHVSYRIESLEPSPFHFLFKQHLPIAITPQCRLSMPGGEVIPVDPNFGTLRNRERFSWPGGRAANTVDLSIVPPVESRAREFVYVLGVPEGWCGADDTPCGASLRFTFDRQTFPYVWLFLTYGGWRDCYTAVLEPCTNFPKELGAAVARGQSALLKPGEAWETQVSVILGPVQ